MIIGLTQRVLFHKGRAYDSIEQSWYTCLKDHKLVYIPNRNDIDVKIDLLIITGGNNPPIRAQTEAKLIDQMLLENKPIIGVCHGAFLLTEHFGGIVGDTNKHMDCEHTITVGDDKQIVNSFHTLQIIQPPPHSTTLAKDEDGFCESWIQDNISTVVWHPERMSAPYWPKQIEQFMK